MKINLQDSIKLQEYHIQSKIKNQKSKIKVNISNRKIEKTQIKNGKVLSRKQRID